MPDLTFISGLETLRLDLLARLLLAALLGGVVGLEREWSGKPAGFRTNLLICVGAALLTELSRAVSASAPEGVPADPGRIAAQIVSGIGFLGAGTIIQSRGNVTGLTTAATLWVVAAIGMAVGAHAYGEAVGATALVMVALLILGRVEPWVGQHEQHDVTLRIAGAEVGWSDAVETRLGRRLGWEMVALERLDGGDIVATYRVTGRARHWERLVTDLLAIDGVRSVRRG
ncbi:MAG: MgtC/SapB family protein [Gemmatimonadota bacterium]|jgi:putative Mg2+ transporter-C (MgtC) family protein